MFCSSNSIKKLFKQFWYEFLDRHSRSKVNIKRKKVGNDLQYLFLYNNLLLQK